MTRFRFGSFVLVAAALWLAAVQTASAERVLLKAADGVTVTADLYASAGRAGPWIVLGHMAGSSRGEYAAIAPRLNRLGYNALAIDLRAGSSFGDVKNLTVASARKAGKGSDYLDAIPDIEAGIAYVRARTRGPVLLWGSSYSAALALLLAGERPGLVDGVIAFSPGEYLSGRPVGPAAARIQVPVLVVSPPAEAGQWRAIYEAVPHARKASFTPESGGVHGSSALIPAQSPDAAAHWRAVEAFLARYFKP